MKDNLKKILPKILLFLVVSIVVIIVLLSLNDISEIGKVLKNVNWNYLLLGIGFLFLYMLFYPFSLYLLSRKKEEGEKGVSYLDSQMIGNIEYFFNGITPFSSGGQPFQVYSYSKIGVKLSKASGMILMNFVVTQLAIVILCLLSLFYYNNLTGGQLYLQIMIIIGLGMNIFILALFASVGLSKTIRNLLIKFVTWLFNLKLFKGKFVKYIASFENYCDGAQNTFKELLTQKLKFVFCLITKLIGLICYYAIPIFILRSLGIKIEAEQIALIIAMTTFAIAMTCYIPTPGASGGIEFAFQSLFVSIIPTAAGSVAVSGMLLWRLITYYLLMLLSFISYLVFEQITNRRLKKQKLEENIEIQEI